MGNNPNRSATLFFQNLKNFKRIFSRFANAYRVFPPHPRNYAKPAGYEQLQGAGASLSLQPGDDHDPTPIFSFCVIIFEWRIEKKQTIMCVMQNQKSNPAGGFLDTLIMSVCELMIGKKKPEK